MVCQLSPQGLESATLWSRFSPAAPLRTGVRGSSLASAGAPAGPNPGPSILPDPGPPDFGPRAAPCLQGPKSQSFLRFFAPSGAKSWGSGGAPPTNLILLRNQRAAHATSFAPTHARHDGPTRGPTRPPQAPPGPPRPRGWWLLVVGGWVGDGGHQLERFSGGRRRASCSECAPGEGGVTSVFAGYDCGVASLLCPRSSSSTA